MFRGRQPPLLRRNFVGSTLKLNCDPKPVVEGSSHMGIDITDIAAATSSPADVPTKDNVTSNSTPRPLTRLPHLPPKLLKRHGCFIATDTRFRAAARLLQSLQREAAGIPIGPHTSISGSKRRRVRLGSRLPQSAAQTGRNFISPRFTV